MSNKQRSILAVLTIVSFTVWALLAAILLSRPRTPNEALETVAAKPPTASVHTVVSPTRTTEPSPSPGAYTGKMVYIQDSADQEIWTMNSDGTNPVRLSTGALDENPVWSPNGSKIAFDSDRGTTSGRRIFVMNSDGTSVTPLTSDQWDSGRPAWSPDGKRIAFSSQQDSATYGLCTMESNGKNIECLLGARWEDHPTWSPDGRKIAFQRWDPDDIYFMDLGNGNAVSALTTTGMESEPQWSPDGSRIVFTSRREFASGALEVYVMNSDGSNPVNLSRHSAWDFHPSWSPDGTKITFASDRDGDVEIYVMNADGTGVTQLTHNVVDDFAPDWIY